MQLSKNIFFSVVISALLNFRQFFIVNPTDVDINFVWSREDCADSNPSHQADFTCSPMSGTIESGKKSLVEFQYISENLELSESFWRFFIQEHNISVPFLLVGHTHEPAVSFDRSRFNFREILIGIRTVFCTRTSPFLFFLSL